MNFELGNPEGRGDSSSLGNSGGRGGGGVKKPCLPSGRGVVEFFWNNPMGGWREVSISHRPVTSSDLKQEGSFFRRTVSTFLQLFVWVVTLLESYDVTNNVLAAILDFTRN